MTLILTIANVSGVYQSSDYQLTDCETGAPVTDRAGSKQLQASFRGLDVRVAFTGIATVGGRSLPQRTVDWLAKELKMLPQDSVLKGVCEALAERGRAITRPHGLRGVLEIILTAAAPGEPFHVAVISNVDWREHPPRAKAEFDIWIHKITKPFRRISGYRDSVPTMQRHRLRALARDTGKSPAQVLDELAEINAIAAEHGRGYISEKCWVTSQVADGRVRRSASRNVGEAEGDVSIILGGFDVSGFVRKNFRAEPGKGMRIVQSAGATYGPGDGTPVPAPTGEFRTFTLSGSSVAGLLRSQGGPSISIAQLECPLKVRCNEDRTVPFASVVLRGGRPIGAAFPKPLLPWPHLSPNVMIDGVTVPRGWEYSVGYWVENGAHHVVIPQSSRSVRTLAFLGPEDEMVIVAPSRTMEFVWGESEEAPSATVEARVWWRSRLDGTRG